jgi:hypothetical protein
MKMTMGKKEGKKSKPGVPQISSSPDVQKLDLNH